MWGGEGGARVGARATLPLSRSSPQCLTMEVRGDVRGWGQVARAERRGGRARARVLVVGGRQVKMHAP